MISNCPDNSYGSDSSYSSDGSYNSDGSDFSTCSNSGFKIYYGRTNRLKIKLCHDFCETCYELGSDNGHQKCLSCLPEYQYDYLHFFGRESENPDNCVPEGYYFQKDSNKYDLKLCESTNYFYIDIDGKRICFKIENAEYPCPIEYPFFNEETRECSNYNMLIFNHKVYQLNGFAKNKNGDVLIQYNEYNNIEEINPFRLFYGLTKDGGYFFSNKSSYTHEFNINISEDILEYSDFLNSYKIQDSKSLFISIKNDNNKGNQYLFSINSFYSMVELYDLNNKDNYYQIWSFNEFFSLDEHDYYFPFEYELFEIKKSSKYIIAFYQFLKLKKL